MKTKLTIIAVLISGYALAQKSLVDYFLPMEPKMPLVSTGIWGDSNVLPRDTTNGLEDATLKDWCYWDGSIVKDDEGKYHMYASRWAQSNHHSLGWKEQSKGMHAVSDSWYGPFKDVGETWPYWMDGRGHNVIGLRMHDGRYALVGSEIIPGNIWTSENPYGPFEYEGQIQLDYNGFIPGTAHYNKAPNHMANVMVLLRPDGRYMIVPRQCSSLISEDGIMGPYKVMHGAAWANLEGLPQENMEDPTVWYSDGLYHIVVNYHGEDKSFHLTSRDGIHHWKNRGIAMTKESGIFKYKNGDVNEWSTVQRPTVYIEDDTVRAFNFSVIDVHKGSDGANDNHGSKIVVIPFDGKAFGDAMREIVRKEDAIVDATPIPEPWKSLDIGNPQQTGASNYNAQDKVFKIRSAGSGIAGAKDDFRFVYQKMGGDFMLTAQVMMQDNTDPNAKAGVMIRESLDADSRNAAMLISAANGANFQYRTEKSASTDSIHNSGIRAPYWVRLLKTGNKVVSYVSSSPHLPFEAVGYSEISFDTDSLFVGLALCSNADSINITRFQHIDVSSFLGQDMILSHNLPEEIPSTYPIKIEVEYLTSEPRDLNVLIRNVTNWDNGVGNVTKTVNGYGKTVLEFTPGKAINDTCKYEWEMNLREEGKNWKTNIEGTQFKVRGYQVQPTKTLQEIIVSKKTLQLIEGDTISISASNIPTDASEQEIVWLSDNQEIAQVDYVYGKIYALGIGDVNIVALNPATGIRDTCRLTVQNTTLGVNKKSDFSVAVYPNPFDESFFVDNEEQEFQTISVYNLAGRLVYSKDIAGNSTPTIILKGMKPNVYIVHIEGDSQSERVMVIKK